MTTTSVSPVQTIPSDDLCSACSRSISNMTDFIACGHVGLHILFIRERLLGYLFDRNVNSPFLFATLVRNVCQFPGIFCLSQIHAVGVYPSFPLVPYHN